MCMHMLIHTNAPETYHTRIDLKSTASHVHLQQHVNLSCNHGFQIGKPTGRKSSGEKHQPLNKYTPNLIAVARFFRNKCQLPLPQQMRLLTTSVSITADNYCPTTNHKCIHIHIHIDLHTDINTHTHILIHTYIYIHKERYVYAYIYIHIYDTHKHTHRATLTDTHRHTHAKTQPHTDTHTDTLTHADTRTHTDTPTDTHKHRHTDTHTH